MDAYKYTLDLYSKDDICTVEADACKRNPISYKTNQICISDVCKDISLQIYKQETHWKSVK